MWALKLDLSTSGVLSFDTAATYGLQASDLVSDDYGPCENFGTRVRADAALPSTWLVPSAALPGSTNVVVFGPRVMSAFDADPIDPTVDVPATIAAERATPPAFLLPHVRRFGAPHDAFEAWNKGDAFDFREAYDFTLPV